MHNSYWERNKNIYFTIHSLSRITFSLLPHQIIQRITWYMADVTVFVSGFIRSTFYLWDRIHVDIVVVDVFIAIYSIVRICQIFKNLFYCWWIFGLFPSSFWLLWMVLLWTFLSVFWWTFIPIFVGYIMRDGIAGS